MTFWKTATQDQRLAQIDGGIECGMTGTQIAMNVGTAPHTVRQFAAYHGRSLARIHDILVRSGQRGGIVGGIVNARRLKKPETSQDSAFTIFESQSNTGLFDRHPND